MLLVENFIAKNIISARISTWNFPNIILNFAFIQSHDISMQFLYVKIC